VVTYKSWVRAHPTTGYVFQFEMHVGKQDSDQVEVGLGERWRKDFVSSSSSEKYTSHLTTFSHHPA